jgi:hypothetical protein
MWQEGRQGTGYLKLKLFQNNFMDAYILKFPKGSRVPPHKDPVEGKKHYRMNLILRKGKGGEFECKETILNLSRLKLFRPDLNEHSVSEVTDGTRLLLSVGWAIS